MSWSGSKKHLPARTRVGPLDVDRIARLAARQLVNRDAFDFRIRRLRYDKHSGLGIV